MIISRRCVLLGFAGTIMATSYGHAAGTEIAASQGGAIALTAAPTRIALRPAANVDIAARLAASAGERFILVLQGIATDQPPETGYLVFLNAPEGATLSAEDAGYAGGLSFFGAPPPGADANRAVSFEVTDVLQRLRAAGRLGGNVTVTISPAGKLAPQSHPTIKQIALIGQ